MVLTTTIPIMMAGWAIGNNLGSNIVGSSGSVDNSSSKKAVAIEAASESGSSIFPDLISSPLSWNSPTYDYSPSEQNVYHKPYENYQPSYTDSRQYDITYPVYNYITDSNGAVITNKKDSTLKNENDISPSNAQTYSPAANSGNSEGIDPLLLIGGAALVLIALGGIAIVSK